MIHDETTNRTTGVAGIVAEMSLAELKELDAGSFFSPNFAASKIPTLVEVLELLDQVGFNGILNIELKTDKTAYVGIVQKVYRFVQAKSRNYSVVYSSFNYDTLIEMKKIDDQNQIALLFETNNRNLIELDGCYPVEAWHPHYKWAKLRLLNEVPNLPMRVWTVNDSDDIRYFIKAKVAAIITDYPERALEIRATMVVEEKV